MLEWRKGVVEHGEVRLALKKVYLWWCGRLLYGVGWWSFGDFWEKSARELEFLSAGVYKWVVFGWEEGL